MFKPFINGLFTFKERRVGGYLNNGFFLKQIKQVSNIIIKKDTQHIKYGKRRVERAGCLLEKFETNPLMIESAVFQDESNFSLQIPINSQNDRVYFKGRKKDVPDKNPSHQTNR